MATTPENTVKRRDPGLQGTWDRIRAPLSLALAGLFNVATACYNFRGLQLLEGNMPWLTIPLGIALAVSKTIAEKEFCANLYRKRPKNLIGITTAFVMFVTVAVTFNALNVLHQQAEVLSTANREAARAERWQHDVSQLMQTQNQIRSAATQRIEKIESQMRDLFLRIDAARKSGDLPSYAERDRLKAEQRTLLSIQTTLNGLGPLAVDPPADPKAATNLLSSHFAKIRDLRAQLAPDLQAGITDPKPTLEAPVSKHPAIMLAEETRKRSPAAALAWFVAAALEALALCVLLLGQSGITVSERIEGIRLAFTDTMKLTKALPPRIEIPFVVAGTGVRGCISVDGPRPIFRDELQRAIEEIQPTLQIPVARLCTEPGIPLIDDVDVLDQLAARELILETRL